ncbi:MAG: hypothetical protein WD802_00515 [Gemmatimonadaceae bacterium]
MGGADNIDESLDFKTGRVLYSLKAESGQPNRLNPETPSAIESTSLATDPHTPEELQGTDKAKVNLGFEADLRSLESAVMRLDSVIQRQQHVDYASVRKELELHAQRATTLVSEMHRATAIFPSPSVALEYLLALQTAIADLAEYVSVNSGGSPSYEAYERWRRSQVRYYQMAIQLGRGPAQKTDLERYLRLAFYPILLATTIIGASSSGALGALTGFVIPMLMRYSLRQWEYTNLHSSQRFTVAVRDGALIQAALVFVAGFLTGWDWGWLGALGGFVAGIFATRLVVVAKEKKSYDP